MGADSIAMNGWARDIIAESKMFKRCGMLFGCAGNPRMAQILRYQTVFKAQMGAQSDEEWLVCEVVERARVAFKEYGYTETENGRELGASFLLGYKGKLYSVEGSFQLCRSARKMCAMGAGDDFALGALHATLKQFETWSEASITSAINHALQTASELSSAVAGPFMVEKLS
jgi:ATP-dependent protease HslVU (ClpYQ) peptidase subunit